MKVAWFSCGATSAVACKLGLKLYPELGIYYIETGSHHPDNKRFLKDCEKWFGKEIVVLKSEYKDVADVVLKKRFINSPYGAACTKILKTQVRQKFEYENDIDTYIWGFEKGKKEENRAFRMRQRYPNFKHIFPLIDNNLDKEECLCILKRAGIDLPEMYRLGYHNNNCIGCVKGGAGYWNRIRKDFPDQFKKMAKIEREIGHSCLKKYFLDELPLDAGRNEKELEPRCSIFCGLINEE
ncbi:MAG: phosphoadenosine phosphosulfate reductase family protein [Elusimicrobiales bacterium]|nr:phosphoadenosine phosphosulfate reductase family protein [Elusimicrobiales bacterium]